MLLTARMLKNVESVNSYDHASAVEFTAGDQVSVYFQLTDATRDRQCNGYYPIGRRFIPASGASLQVTVDSLDDDKKVVRAATQPYAQDPSIWRVDLLSTDRIRGTVTMRLALTEGSKVTRGSLSGALLVKAQ